MSEEQAVKFKIDGKVYDTASVDEISLRDIVLFNSQAADIGLGVTWADVERIATETAERAESDGPHPEAMVMFAVTVWAARRIAGEDVTLGEAIDVPMSKIEIVEARKAPKDHQPKKKSGSKSTRASGLAVAPPSSDQSVETTTHPTSSESSASA